MEIQPQCLACLAGLAHKGVNAATQDPALQIQTIQKALAALSRHNPVDPAPVAAAAIQAIIAEQTGCTDPYLAAKEESTRLALAMFPALKENVAQSPDPMGTALRLAIAGNIIDFATLSQLDEDELQDHMNTAADHPVQGDLPALIQRLSQARNILWITDNAGEIVFDRLVLEQLDPTRLTLAVRGGPALNDATRADAAASRIPEAIPVMDTGLALPGTRVADSSPEFQARFTAADLIISKGQGNFETLPHDDPRIVFLFQVKCPVIEKNAGFPVGSRMVFSPKA